MLIYLEIDSLMPQLEKITTLACSDKLEGEVPLYEIGVLTPDNRSFVEEFLRSAGYLIEEKLFAFCEKAESAFAPNIEEDMGVYITLNSKIPKSAEDGLFRRVVDFTTKYIAARWFALKAPSLAEPFSLAADDLLERCKVYVNREINKESRSRKSYFL